MPFCERCGRALAENEVCSCMPQNTAQPGAPYPNQPAPGQPYMMNQQPGQPYNYNMQGYPQQPQKKSPVGCIIAAVIAIILFFVTAILAAILIPAMVGYTKKSKMSQANNAAMKINRAVGTALATFEDDDMDISGTYIICSEEDANILVPFSDTDMLYSTINIYFPEASDYDYFVVVEDSTCVYTAAVKSGETCIGTYPESNSLTPVRYSGGPAENDWDIADLYSDAAYELFD